jgi:hypothetical protein
MDHVKEAFIEEEPLRVERAHLPLDDALRFLQLVTVWHGIEFDAIRTDQGLADQVQERSNATEIGRTVIGLKRHTLVVVERRLRHDRGKPTTASGVSADEPDGRM